MLCGDCGEHTTIKVLDEEVLSVCCEELVYYDEELTHQYTYGEYSVELAEILREGDR